MATCSISELVDQACQSGFKCLDEQSFRALFLQLLCNIQEGQEFGQITNFSYAINDTWTNETGENIEVFVSVLWQIDGEDGQLILQINGQNVEIFEMALVTANGQQPFHFLMAPGDTFKIINDAFTGVITNIPRYRTI